MKRALIIIVSVILTVAVIVSSCWYFLQYDRDFTRDAMLTLARWVDDSGNRNLSNWLYDLAYRYAGNDDAIAIEIARQHRQHGNYTKAEYTLSNAIADGASAELYIALCKTYVEQDKLMDAVMMLDTIADPQVKREIDAQRPQIPKADPVQGHYNSYISVKLSSPGNKVYYTVGSDYPTTANGAFSKPLSLIGGQSTIRAISIGENGLVSSLAVLDYTVTGVIEQVVFEDAAIEKAIRQQLMVDESHTIYTNELWTIETFAVPRNATTLSDLSKLPFLKQLSIDGGKYESLPTLAELVTLEDLSISDLVLSSTDMAAIGSLKHLKKLTLSNCALSSIEALTSLTELTSLNLSSNTLRDLTVISGFSNLEYLNLSHNAVTDLKLLSDLKKLTELDLSFNAIASTEPLSSCTALAALNVNHNLLSGLDGLDQLSNLRSLSAAFNQLQNVDNLSDNVTLEFLDISNNTITDITELNTLHNLSSFNFSYNKVTKLPAFATDCALVTIKGSQNSLSSLEELEGLENLNYVIMDHNSAIKSLTPLIKCPLLVEVSVYGTAVKDVKALQDMDILVKYSPI